MSKKNYKGNKSNDNTNKENNNVYQKNNTRGNNRRNNNTVSRNTNQGTQSNCTLSDIHTNDPSWWNRSSTFSDAVRVPFNVIQGNPVDMSRTWPKGAETIGIQGELSPIDGESLPGIMRINYYPTIGLTTDGNSAINRFFTNMWMEMYARTTGTIQFEQTDLGLLVIGLGSIMTNIYMARRALGLTLLWSQDNYYYPRAVMMGCGVDPDSINGNQDYYRMKLNEQIANFNAIRLPNFLDYFKRCVQLAHNIYMDEDDIVSQLYAFVPNGYYIYTDTGSAVSEYSHLLYEDFNFTSQGKTISMDGLLEVIDRQLDAWRTSADLGIISGTVQRAFNDRAFIEIDYVPLGEVTIPVPDTNMAYQINNAVITGPVKTESLNITQDPVKNVLYCQPQLSSNKQMRVAQANGFYLNSYTGDTGPDFIIEATRLMAHAKADGYLDVCPLEIVSDLIIVGLDKFEGEVKPSGYQVYGLFQYVQNDHNFYKLAEMLRGVINTSKFRFAPRVFLSSSEINDSEEIQGVGFLGDTYRYTVIDVDSLVGLMTTAYQSIYLPVSSDYIK